MNREPEDMQMPDIESEVLTLHDALNVRTTVDKARRIGELLLEVKRRLGHGEFLPWLKRVGMKARTAQTYVQVAKAPIAPGSAHLSIDRLLQVVRNGRKVQRRDDAAALADTCESPDIRSRIIHGDALKWLGQQETDSIPFIFSDPPYGVGTTYEDWTEPDNPLAYWEWFRPFWDEMTRVVQPGGAIILYQAYAHLPHFFSWYPGCRIVADCFVWQGLRSWEPVIYWVKPGAKSYVMLQGYSDWYGTTRRRTR